MTLPTQLGRIGHCDVLERRGIEVGGFAGIVRVVASGAIDVRPGANICGGRAFFEQTATVCREEVSQSLCLGHAAVG
jgi:hypothetical protein